MMQFYRWWFDWNVHTRIYLNCTQIHLLHSRHDIRGIISIYTLTQLFNTTTRVKVWRRLLGKICGALLKQSTWWHFGSVLHRLCRFLSEHKLISGKERMWSVFFSPVCFPRVYFWPLSVLEWRMHFGWVCWNV